MPSAEECVRIFADHRESASNVNRHLEELGAKVECRQLKVGDYILSKRVCVERKTTSDFIGSMMNQRLFRQLEEISSNFDSPVLILEGSPSNLFCNGIHPNAVRGALSSISVDYRIPMLWTQNPRETAAQIYRMAHREQIGKTTEVSVRGAKKPAETGRLQEFIVAGLPSVNSRLSARLLERFGSVKGVFTATHEELVEIDKIGDKKASQILEILDLKYRKPKKK
jgi:ERCC4-type nuclease